MKFLALLLLSVAVSARPQGQQLHQEVVHKQEDQDQEVQVVQGQIRQEDPEQQEVQHQTQVKPIQVGTLPALVPDRVQGQEQQSPEEEKTVVRPVSAVTLPAFVPDRVQPQQNNDDNRFRRQVPTVAQNQQESSEESSSEEVSKSVQVNAPVQGNAPLPTAQNLNRHTSQIQQHTIPVNNRERQQEQEPEEQVEQHNQPPQIAQEFPIAKPEVVKPEEDENLLEAEMLIMNARIAKIIPLLSGY